MEAAVSFKRIFFAYEQEPVLKDVSFTVMPGEFIGLIGPNGGGKTTLLKLIMGFVRPQSGLIEVFGKPPCSALAEIAYVPQNLRYDRQFPISVLELVLSGRLSRLPWYGAHSQEDYQAAADALEQVGMLSFRDHSFGTLSGGQAQRALIARALVSHPKLLLLDEPTASVDSQAESDIYKILRGLQGKMTIIMVTHNLKVAIDMVERVLCVQREVISLLPQEVCEHFTMGLYHAPLQIESNRQKR
jgi:zinc transport system ATP-binding protein